MSARRGLHSLVFCLVLSLSAFASEPRQAANLASLPPQAQSGISAALGRDLPAYYARARSRGYRIEDAGHRLAVDFTANGIEARSGGADWRMRLSGYGYEDSLEGVSRIAPEAAGNRVQYRHGPLTEWYVNGPRGLEQGFTIDQAPGKAKGRLLTVVLTLSGNLQPVDVDHTALDLVGAGVQPKLRYAGLAAQDATGKELPARLEVRGQQLLLKVNDRGARYPVVIDPWLKVAELTASDGAADDESGWSIAVSGDTVVVGAPFHTVGSNQHQGAAYVYVEGSHWTSMTQTAELTASDGTANADFGSSVAISGNTIVVGASGASVNGNSHQGAAYVFVEPTDGWANMTQSAELIASDGYVGFDFGASVAIDGNTVVVGSPYASVGPNFEQGLAYMFVEPANGWTNMTQTAELSASDGAANDIFGDAVAVNRNTVVVGASEATVNGVSNAGAAYVFVQPTSGWANMTQTAKLTASDGQQDSYFGTAVDISGSTVAVGAPSDYAGVTYVFVQPANGWKNMTQTAELTVSGQSSPLLLGTAVAVSGNMVVASAVAQNQYAGVVYGFVEPANGWTNTTQAGSITAGDGAPGDYFGHSLSMISNTIVVGSPFHQVSSNPQGAGYVFVTPNPKPSLSSISPNSAIVGGPGFTLTAYGGNFVINSVVEWAWTPQSTTYVSPTELQAAIPASEIAQVGTHKVFVSNPGPGGGASNSLIFTVENPQPSTQSLSPNSANAGGDTFTLTVYGSNFVSSSKVQWNGSRLSTTFVSSTELTATVYYTFLTSPGTVAVTVVTPGPGGGTSNGQTFTIVNAIPILKTIYPAQKKAGGQGFTMNLTGTFFTPKSQVLWNGSPRSTTYVGRHDLEAAILASDIKNAGTAKVTVLNPAPGGGKSNALTFTINK